METKFKIGDEVYFLDYKTPKKDVITGISVFWGVDKNVNKRSTLEGQVKVYYYTSEKYSELEETELFKTKQALIDSLFSSLE